MISGEKLKITAYLVAIFLIGCIAGGFATSAFRGRPRPPMFTNMTARQMEHLKEELALSQEQVARIKPIMIEVNEAALAVRRSTMSEFARLYGEMAERVEAELTPAQVSLFRVHQEERRLRAESMRRGDRDRKGPGGPEAGRRDRQGRPWPEGPGAEPPPPEGPPDLPPPPSTPPENR